MVFLFVFMFVLCILYRIVVDTVKMWFYVQLEMRGKA